MSMYEYIFTNLTPEQIKAVGDCFGNKEGQAIAWVGQRRPYRSGLGVFFTKGDWKALRDGSARQQKLRPKFSAASVTPYVKRHDKKLVLKKGMLSNFVYGYARKRDTLHSIFSIVEIDGQRLSIKNFENFPLVLSMTGPTFFTLRAKRGNTRVRGSLETCYRPSNLFDGLMASLFNVLDHRKELRAKGLLPL